MVHTLTTNINQCEENWSIGVKINQLLLMTRMLIVFAPNLGAVLCFLESTQSALADQKVICGVEPAI